MTCTFLPKSYNRRRKEAKDYEVEVGEILDGERKDTMNSETEETMRKIADYNNVEREFFSKRMCMMFAIAILGMVVFAVIDLLGKAAEMTVKTAAFKPQKRLLPRPKASLRYLDPNGQRRGTWLQTEQGQDRCPGSAFFQNKRRIFSDRFLRHR